ncbi:LacI family DNA-binding transcriptional regulator [uncultured Devosia sp.]|uniref:LacI family DNA-binding transcriptional regulator n=1 Tax=uncultured Devosia sp. TaxID=211434 RepID=UPI0026384FD8|nr:LacI family DNA-binding transcriptional regulator [uncultured Devosia sp.]
MVTITDVSKRAGVSRSTVSRVVAGNGYVSEDKRKAIEAAIAELGYRPNTLAQALRSNRSNLIGAVMVDIGTPYFANMIYGVQRATRPAGKSLIVSSGYADQDEEARAVIELVDRSCDGIVLYLERPMRENVVEIVRKARIPVVAIGHSPNPVAQGRVVLDNFEGARAAMNYLLEQGHRKIVHLSGQVDFGDTVARMRGMETALAEHGMTLDDIHVVNGIFHQDFGYSATRDLIASGRDFTAIFAGDDDMAAGVLLALREAGLRVPEDVSVMGFDDAFHAKHMWPPLTTVRQPVDTLGEVAASLLLRLLGEPRVDPLQSIVETNLVVRASVCAPRLQREVA